MHAFSFFNDSVVNYTDLNLHISDLGIQRGFAIFDYFQIKNGKIHWKDDYFDRFYNSAELADLIVPFNPSELEDIIKDIINKNESPNSFIKLLLTGGYSDDGFNYPGKSNFMILNYEKKEKDPAVYENGVNLISTYYQRPTPEIKTTNYFMSASLYKKRKQYNAVDVLYHLDGIVTEASRANFYIIRDEEIFTTEDDVLPGVTRKNFLSTIEKHYMVNRQNVWLEDIWDADGAFITSTTKGVMPIVKIDDTEIAGGKVTDIMKDVMTIFNPLT